MNKRLTLTAAAVILAGSSVTASAYWGGPFSGWGDDFFGDGFFDFNFSASAHGNGWGRGYGYDNPYWGYAPYGAYGAPYALTTEQQQALTEQQQKAMEAHQAQLAQMVEEQRKFAEQFAKGDFDPMANMPEAFEDPMAPPLPEAMKSRMEQAKAEREARMKVVAERREAMIKEMEQRRASVTPVSFQAPMYRETPKTTY